MAGETEENADTMLAEAAAQIQDAIADGIEDNVDESEEDNVDESEEDNVDESEEDNVDESKEDNVDDTEDDDDEGPDPEEIKARKAGWRPKDEYKGDPKNWKDYDEFNRVGEQISSKLNSKIDSQTQEIAQQKKMIQKLIKAQGTIMKQAHEEAVESLKAERRIAIENGDVDTVEAIDEKIAKADEVKPDLEAEEDEDSSKEVQVDEAVTEFVQAEKSWFNRQNPDMVKYALSVEEGERAVGETDSAAIMARVKDAVAQRFPGRVTTLSAPKRRKRATSAAVETGGGSLKPSASAKLSDFPQEVREIANYFEKNNIMTKAEYLKQLKEGMS